METEKVTVRFEFSRLPSAADDVEYGWLKIEPTGHTWCVSIVREPGNNLYTLYKRSLNDEYSMKNADTYNGVIEYGRGYSGGHQTAAARGWGDNPPARQKGALFEMDCTRQGAFTGYFPATLSFPV